MDTSTEPDHRRQLRDSVADFIERTVSTSGIREDIASPEGFSLAQWKKMAALGWTSLLLPEDLDGLGMEYGDLAALHVEVGRAPCPEPLAVVPLLVGQALAIGGNRALARRVLPELVAGDMIATLAWQGVPGALGAKDVGPSANPVGDGWRLSGSALFVPCASSASALIVATKTADGIALLWLGNMPPLSDSVRHADGSSQASVHLDGVSVGPDALIAGPDRGGDILETVLDTARFAACAELLGIVERALEMTLDYLRQRHQFGRPIGSFQALQHRAVDLYIQTELSRSALERAAHAFDSGADASIRAIHVSAAKSRIGDTARSIVRECIQMHGAIGYTSEYDLSLFVNRALFLSGWLGNASVHRRRWSILKTAVEHGDGR